jgi:hypothetical protein
MIFFGLTPRRSSGTGYLVKKPVDFGASISNSGLLMSHSRIDLTRSVVHNSTKYIINLDVYDWLGTFHLIYYSDQSMQF